MSPKPATSAPSPARPRVFVVDDDDAVRAAVSMLVRTCDWEAVPCENAEEFLTLYSPHSDQCLVLDLCMPGMSGIDLQRELRRRGDSLPVIVITAHHDLPEARLAVRHGARTVLKKPFNDQDLLDEIRQAL